MKKRWVAGALMAGFALYAGSIAELYYPEEFNQAYQALGERAGLLEPVEPLPPPPEPPRYFITAGADIDNPQAYLPQMAAEGCSADHKVVRLAYETAIVTDGEREKWLAHPRINGNEDRYLAQRRDVIAGVVGEAWADAVRNMEAEGLDYTDRAQGDALQDWLNDRARELQTGQNINLAFRVNVAHALDIAAPRTDAVDACSPEGFVPAAPQTQPAPGPSEPDPF